MADDHKTKIETGKPDLNSPRATYHRYVCNCGQKGRWTYDGDLGGKKVAESDARIHSMLGF